MGADLAGIRHQNCLWLVLSFLPARVGRGARIGASEANGPMNPAQKPFGLFNDLHQEFVTPIVPDENQKKRVHERLSLLFEDRKAPDYLQPHRLLPHTVTSIAADKFADNTVRMLAKQKWIGEDESIPGIPTYQISLAAANVIMAALANECSSDGMPPITRDPGGFKAACNTLLHELASPQGLAFGERVDTAIEKPVEADLAFLLAPVPHLSIGPNVTAGDLRSLMKARHDPDLNGLREAYCRRIDAYLAQLRSAEGGERRVIRDQFAEEHRIALSKLKSELQRVGLRSLFSKDGLCALVVASLVSLAAPGLGVAVGLTGGLLEYQQKRREVFDKNWVSWAFLTGEGKITLF